MSASNHQPEDPLQLVLLDAQGRPCESPDAKGPFYRGVKRPDCNMTLGDELTCYGRNFDEIANELDLPRTMTYMAQSETGLQAIKTLSDNNIQIGLLTDILGTELGYDVGARKIALDPTCNPESQSLLLIQYAAYAETGFAFGLPESEIDDPVFAFYAAQTMKAMGIASVVLHGEQCLAAARQNPQRFVPPALEKSLNEYCSEMIAMSWEESCAEIRKTSPERVSIDVSPSSAVLRLLSRLELSLERAQKANEPKPNEQIAKMHAILNSFIFCSSGASYKV